MKFKLIFLLLLICASAQISPQIMAEKPLRTELKRYFNTEAFNLKELAVPTQYKVSGKFYEIQSLTKTIVKYVYTGRVNTSRGKGGGDNSDFLDYFILYSPGQEVIKVKVHNIQSSHGQSVSAPGWLKQFIGHNKQKTLEIGKNIDAISGATISVNKLTFDIQSKTIILSDITKQ
jgi:hypothetical protein